MFLLYFSYLQKFQKDQRLITMSSIKLKCLNFKFLLLFKIMYKNEFIDQIINNI